MPLFALLSTLTPPPAFPLARPSRPHGSSDGHAHDGGTPSPPRRQPRELQFDTGLAVLILWHFDVEHLQFCFSLPCTFIGQPTAIRAEHANSISKPIGLEAHSNDWLCKHDCISIRALDRYRQSSRSSDSPQFTARALYCSV